MCCTYEAKPKCLNDVQNFKFGEQVSFIIAKYVVVGYGESVVLEGFVPLKALYQYMMVPDIDEYKLRIEYPKNKPKKPPMSANMSLSV